MRAYTFQSREGQAPVLTRTKPSEHRKRMPHDRDHMAFHERAVASPASDSDRQEKARMNQPKKLTMAAMSLVMVAATATVMLTTLLPIGGAVGQQKSQEGDVQRVEAAAKDFIAAISARDIEAMDKLWGTSRMRPSWDRSARQSWSGGMA